MGEGGRKQESISPHPELILIHKKSVMFGYDHTVRQIKQRVKLISKTKTKREKKRKYDT